MSFIKFLKNKKDGDKKSKKEIKKSEKKKIEKKNSGAGKTNGKLTVSERQKTGYAPVVYRTIKFPHITEKSADLASLNKYVFRVFSGANKIEVAKSIAELYGVKVKSVNMINIHRKKRFVRRREGYKSGYKKAIVTLKQGYKIEMLSH